jgi:hypothetical protein
MSMLSLENAIAIAGGGATIESCPEVIPNEVFREFMVTFHQTNTHFESIAQRAGVEIDWAVAVTKSPAFSCTVREVQGGYAILIPLGMLARVRVVARLLLRHWRVKRVPRFIRAPVDNVDDDPDSIPPLLKPIFLETLPPEEFWGRLLELDRSLKLDSDFEQDVAELVHLGIVYLLSHEFTHALHGHFPIISKARAGACEMDLVRLLRGLELDADDGAAAITMLILSKDIVRANTMGQEASMDLGWLRLAYAVTMIFAISDTLRKHYPAYKEGAYNHPMVRCEFFFDAAERAIAEPEDVKIMWRANSTKGWERCVCALEMLNLEAFSGQFGALPPGKQHVPLHTMLYSASPTGSMHRALRGQLRQTGPLLAEVRRLLPIFQQT